MWFSFLQKAKKKKIDKKSPEDLGVDVAPRIEVLNVVDPPVRSAGVKVETVDDLLTKLKEHGFPAWDTTTWISIPNIVYISIPTNILLYLN
jgi:electron transfer flavoprotein beta subunit